MVNDPVPMQETWVSPPVREEPTRYPYASVMESVLQILAAASVEPTPSSH